MVQWIKIQLFAYGKNQLDSMGNKKGGKKGMRRRYERFMMEGFGRIWRMGNGYDKNTLYTVHEIFKVQIMFS